MGLRSSEALQGRLGAAEEELRSVRSVREQVYGFDDPDTLATREHLVWVVGSAGRVEEALLACDAVLNDTVRVLGIEHPHALVGRSRRIWLLGWPGGGPRRSPSGTGSRRCFPTAAPDLDDLRCATVTAWLLRLDGRLDESEREARRAVKLHNDVVGAHEVDTMRSLDALGLVYLEKHRLEEAEIVFRDVLERRAQELGEAHVDTLVAANTSPGCLFGGGSGSRRHSNCRSCARGHGRWTPSTRWCGGCRRWAGGGCEAMAADGGHSCGHRRPAPATSITGSSPSHCRGRQGRS
jgi:hypothetical protein